VHNQQASIMSKRSTTLAYFSIPAFLSAWSFLSSLRHEFSLEMVFMLFYNSFFLTVPYLLWFGISARLHLTKGLWHAGFVASSLALLFTVISPFFLGRDPSGLPYHWLFYWPLAFLGQVVFGLGVIFLRRVCHNVA
jgi:hypothetical protein